MSLSSKIALALALTLAPLNAAQSAAYGPSMDAGVIEATNAYRASQGAGSLEVNPHLTAAAQSYAAFYAANPGQRTEWGHEFGGTTPFERARAAGYEGTCIGENLGWQATTASPASLGDVSEAMMQGWLDSPDHHANLIHAPFDQIGVGSARFELDGFTWIISVQMFGCAR